MNCILTRAFNDRFRTSAGWILIAISVLLLMLPSAAQSALTPQVDAKANNLDRWNIPIQNMGVGTAYAAEASGLQGGLTNPASLSRLANNEFSVEFQNWGQGWNLYNGGVAVPYYGGHGFAFHGTWLDYGELEPQSKDELFRPRGNEFRGGMTYSYRFAPSTAFGVSTQVMSSKIGFRDRKNKLVGDLGVLSRLTPGLWMGAVVRNLGSSLQYGSSPDKLPNQYRAGLAYRLWDQRVGFTLDGVYHDPESSSGDSDESGFGLAGGLKLLVMNHYRLSAGYHSIYTKNDGMSGALQIEYPNFHWNLGFIDTGEDQFVRIGGNARF